MEGLVRWVTWILGVRPSNMENCGKTVVGAQKRRSVQGHFDERIVQVLVSDQKLQAREENDREVWRLCGSENDHAWLMKPGAGLPWAIHYHIHHVV